MLSTMMSAIALTMALLSGQNQVEQSVAPQMTEQASCYGCTCSYECWRNGQCRTVCRDSCGRFCYVDEQP